MKDIVKFAGCPRMGPKVIYLCSSVSKRFLLLHRGIGVRQIFWMRNVVAFPFLPAKGFAFDDQITPRVEFGFRIGELRRC